jgi:hypothetical protein
MRKEAALAAASFNRAPGHKRIVITRRKCRSYHLDN